MDRNIYPIYHRGNLFVVDDAVFPASTGANPRLSVFALAAQNAGTLIETIMA